MARRAHIERNTKETQIGVDLVIDGSGNRTIQTPVPFLSHMLDAFAKHGVFDLGVKAAGDIEIDGHHTVEDIGLVLGNAFEQALGDRAGLVRYGWATLPTYEDGTPPPPMPGGSLEVKLDNGCARVANAAKNSFVSSQS